MEHQRTSNARDLSEQHRDVLYQVSLLQGLTHGDYDGSVTVAELKRHGDTGIGTFHRLNGELIMLDGRVYRAAGDGRVEAVSDDETSPFSVVAFLRADETKPLEGLSDHDALRRELERMVEGKGKNHFRMIRIDGLFREIHVRSVYPQEEPYLRLVDVLEHDQTFFDYENVEGTVVGLYCPPYMSHLNAVGWHMHFISKDKTKGGHVIGLAVADAMLTWDDIHAIELRLPQNERFDRFDLTADQSSDIKKVERGG